ncbi:MAG: beta-L-arabinofuranosidase domain-containing protein [Candidatus Omnitrophota bacterium]
MSIWKWKMALVLPVCVVLASFAADLKSGAGIDRGAATCRIDYKIQPAVSLKALPFDLEDVRLLDGPFKKAMELDGEYLLQLEADRLLAGYRENAGLEPKGKKYGGWELQSIAGHSLGHYLTACALMYASTGDERFRERVVYIVKELDECQDERGYVAAIPEGKRIFAEVAAGNIRSAGFDLNGGWVPWYNLHKLLAGLLDAQRYGGEAKALNIAVKLGDWAIGVTSGLNEEQFQKMLACEHGGMNESLAELYARTGEEKYLVLSRRFHHKAMLDPLAEHQDCLPGRHANTQIPKIIGVALRHEYTGDERDKTIAEYFWDTVAHHHSYVIGGNSDHEHFGQPDKLSDRLSDDTAETCNTYNMLKLTRHLFGWSASAPYADYYERALYNHILASQNPDDGMMCYFIPLRAGGAKTYSTPFDSFWCCVGTGMENHAKYGDSIYFHGADGLYVNLFIPSILTWREMGMTVRQETRYPEEDAIRLSISCKQPVKTPIHIRHPRWAEAGMKILCNGSALAIDSQPGSYAAIDRTWKDGDRLEITIPMSLRLEAMPDNSKRAAIAYGPLVLAGDLGAITEKASDDGGDAAHVPVLLTEAAAPEQWMQSIPGSNLSFKTKGVGRPNDVELIPFYRMHHRRYAVYWDFYTEADWNKRQVEIQTEQKRLRELEARTVDVLRIGEMQPERDHNLQGEKTSAGELNGRKWRHAADGGWFSFEMKIKANAPQELACTYWGGDSGARRFDILVDGVKIAEQTLQNNQPGKFYDEIYALPLELVRGKEKITVRLQAHPRAMAGGLFGCRVLMNDE